MVIVSAALSPVWNTEGKGSICMCVMIREVCVYVSCMAFTNSSGYIANVLIYASKVPVHC